MTDFIASLPVEDSLPIELSQLYEQFGYKKYCMAKFEEYSLYSDYRDFLSDEGVIAFNNSDGKLMALKPDITLSIVKNVKIDSGSFTKCYYNENVYRLSSSTHDYKEIKQSGIELLGKINGYATAEVILLALQSLNKIDSDFILTVSDAAFIDKLLERTNTTNSVMNRIRNCIAEKNPHDLSTICKENDIDSETEKKLSAMTSICGSFDDVIPQIEQFADCDEMKSALNELRSLESFIKDCKLADHILIDLSVVNRSGYYNGIVFQGYVKKAPKAVLAGGRYDRLSDKIRKGVEAIGFAVYLDNLNLWYRKSIDYDCDVLIICDNDSPSLLDTVNRLVAGGNKVRVERAMPQNIKAKQVFTYENGLLKEARPC